MQPMKFRSRCSVRAPYRVDGDGCAKMTNKCPETGGW
jgi:hypothetical protein